jgi:hypothetical protein
LIRITNQIEWDRLSRGASSADTNVIINSTTLIEIHDNKQFRLAIVGKSRVNLSNSIKCYSFEESYVAAVRTPISASGNAHISVFDTDAVLLGNVKCYAHGKSIVTAYNSSKVIACDNVEVTSLHESSVEAGLYMDDCCVIYNFSRDVKITALNNTKVIQDIKN